MSKILEIGGVKLSTAASNSRYKRRDDSLIIVIDEGAAISGKFTKNKFKASPIKIAEQHIKNRSKEKRVFIVNAGIANAGTGKKGKADALLCCENVANLFKIKKESVIPFSTGVIGEFLDTKKQIKAFQNASKNLKSYTWNKAASSILTTDTKPKLVSKLIKFGNKEIKIKGFAKGSGMIRPDFATLLSFVFTDAKISKTLLDKIHAEILEESFEAITVDGDTSPNDSSMLVATGQKEVTITKGTKEEKKLRSSLHRVYKDLASMLIQDAEGATKEISIQVLQARSKKQARSVAFTVAESPLVKTALFGNDANWGRILAAIGRAKGIQNVFNVSISLNKLPLVCKGNIDPKYSEKSINKIVKSKNLTIKISIGEGKEKFSVLTSDLSSDYVKINSKYRS